MFDQCTCFSVLPSIVVDRGTASPLRLHPEVVCEARQQLHHGNPLIFLADPLDATAPLASSGKISVAREAFRRPAERERPVGHPDLAFLRIELRALALSWDDPLVATAIRDKFAASKRKGMFMGGPIPIGYRLDNRKLLVDDAEASTVRMIFERYVALRSIPRLVDELAERDVRTKVRPLKDGRMTGGVRFQQGPLATLLKNPVYIGKVAQGGELHTGEHEAIIDGALWDEVQSTIASNRHSRKVGVGVRNPSLLTGMLTNPDGVPMTPTFTTKGSQRFQYYVTRLKPGEDRKEAWRVPAREIDRRVIAALSDWLRSSVADGLSQDARDLRKQLATRTELADAIIDMSIPEQRQLLLDWKVTVQLGPDQLSLLLGDGANITSIELPTRLVHRGPELKLVVPAVPDSHRKPDPVLVKLVVLARAAQQSLASANPDPLVSHYSKRHFWQLLRISWLAPDITAAIIGGTHPANLTGRRLLRATDIPLDWKAQRTYFQFD